MALFFILVFAGYKLGQLVQVPTPTQSPNFTNQTTGQSSPLSGAPSESDPSRPPSLMELQKMVLNGQEEILFTALFDKKILAKQSLEQVLNMVSQRFSRPYRQGFDKINDPYTLETIARAGLLQSIREQFPYEKMTPAQRQGFINLNRSILRNKNESLIVHTEAARNLKPWFSSLSHRARTRQQALLPKQALFLATKPNWQIAREALGQND